MKKALLVLAVSAAVVGCGQSAIDKVKESKSVFDESFTNEQIFANKDFCKSSSWVETKDKFGRELVQMRCQLNFPADYYKHYIDKYGVAKSDEFSSYIASYDKQQLDADKLIDRLAAINTVAKLKDSVLETTQDPKLKWMQVYPPCYKKLQELKRNLDTSYMQPTDADVSAAAKSCSGEFNELDKSIYSISSRYQNNLNKIDARVFELEDSLPKSIELVSSWSVPTEKDEAAKFAGMYMDAESYTGKHFSINVKINKVLSAAINADGGVTETRKDGLFVEGSVSDRANSEFAAVCGMMDAYCLKPIDIKGKFSYIY